MKKPEDVLEYWFGSPHTPEYPADKSELWWKKNPSVDAEILENFKDTLQDSAKGKLRHWRDTRDGLLAHIILVDQMSRNMHRDSALMFAQDDLGQELALLAATSGQAYPNYHQRMFQYMPLMHAENTAMQRLCVHLFAQEINGAADDTIRKAAQNNHDFAIRHAVIIERFGRFPHRNSILGRESSQEEIDFLQQPGSSF